MKKPKNLQELVDVLGDKEFIKLITKSGRVSLRERTVSAYRLGYGHPKPVVAFEIVSVFSGRHAPYGWRFDLNWVYAQSLEAHKGSK